MKTQVRNALTAVLLLLMPTMNFAQAPPLGSAAGFVLFTTVGAVGIDGISQITGNVGSNNGGVTISVNVNGVIGPSAQCAADLLTAYNFLNNSIPNFFPGPLLGNGTTLNAGIYSISSAATLDGNLILDAQNNGSAVFIFKIQGPLSTNANSKIQLINGALACNVFWKVEGLVSMASGSTMRGTVIANNAAINILTGDTLEGRALSTTGAVNLHGVMAYTPIGCGSPVLTGPAAPALLTTQCYGLFSTNGPVSNAGVTYITGDVGTNVGLTTGFNPLFVTGAIHPIADASTAQCAADLGTVYTFLNTLPTDIQLMFPAQFGNNLVLTPHTYLMNAATTFTDTLYLNAGGAANAVFVIKINGALSTSTYSKVILTNGTQAANVYWVVNGAVSINNYSVFNGTIVANNGAILLSTGVTLNGRALTTTGALGTTAITATIPLGSCGTSLPIIPLSGQPVNQIACVGSSASFLVTATGTNLTYQWRKGISNLTNGGNISGATSSTLTINPAGTSDAAVNYNVVVTGTYGSVTSNNASLVVNTLPVPTIITGPASVCVNTAGNSYTTQAGMTNYVWSVSPGGIVTAGGSTTSNLVIVTWNTTGPQFVGINYTNASGCTAMVATTYNVTVNPRPAPTLTGPNLVCTGAIGNVYSTEPGMSNYIWSVSVGGSITAGGGTGNSAITVIWNTGGAQTISVNYNNVSGCSALVQTVYNVTVNPLPVPTITGSSLVCTGFTGNMYITQGGMTNYIWSVSAGGTITVGGTATSNTVTVTWNTTGAQTVSVNYTNSSGCSPTTPVVFNVTVSALPVPIITGQTSLCINSGYYSYTTQANMTAYAWNTSPGAVIANGSGTNTITVSWIVSGAQWLSVNYTTPAGCQAPNPTQLNVTVNPLPDPTGPITGTSNVCAGTNAVAYSVTPIPNTITYTWALPGGATIASGAGTNSITVDYAPNAVSGVLFVWGNNLCGSGQASAAFNVTVTQQPGLAGTITGPSPVCQGTTASVYSVGLIMNANGYTWTVPTGATIINGANTNSITVDFSTTAVSGNISVRGTNTCGTGIVSPNFAVTVNAVPPAPVVTNTGTTLLSNEATGNQWYFEGTLINGATAQSYVATQYGYYWDVVTLNGCSSDASNHQLILVTGIDSHSSPAINVYPNPNEGMFTLMITTPEEENYDIRVFNNLGMQIFEMKNLDVTGTTHQTIDLSSAASGIYTLVTRSNNFYSVKKVVVNK